MDIEAGCSGDSSISDSSQDSESDISDFISYTSSQKRERRKKEKRTKLCDTDDSSSRGGSTNGVGHDQITELNSPTQRTDVPSGNHGLTSPIANKQDMLRARGLVKDKEAEDEAGDDASQSSTSMETESDRQQNQIAHNNEEQTIGASNVVTAETGLGEDGRDNSWHEMDSLRQLAAGDDLSLTHDDFTECLKPSIADRDRILAGNHNIDWASYGDNMNEEPDDYSSDLMAIFKSLQDP